MLVTIFSEMLTASAFQKKSSQFSQKVLGYDQEKQMGDRTGAAVIRAIKAAEQFGEVL
jgi:hypothetical protein